MKLKPLIAITLGVLSVVTICVLMRRHQPQSSEKTVAPLPTRSSGVINTRPKLLGAALNVVHEQPPSAAIQILVDPQSEYGERSGSIKSVTGKLSLFDEAALQAFLLQPKPGDSAQLEQVLKNDLLSELCRLSPPPSWLAETMAEMYRDVSQNVVIRDYAVQHLASLYEQLENAGQNDRQAKDFIQDVLSEAVSESDSSIAGTALLALDHLSEGRSEFDQDKIAGWATQLARNDAASDLTRIAAIQVCGELNVQGAIPTLTHIAQSEQNIPLRIAAIGSLGVLGDSQAIPFLTGVVNGTDARLKLAAQHALDQIQRRPRAVANNQKS
jgi:hypothetical protein